MQLLQHFKELTVNPKNAKELKGLILQLAIQGKLTANWRTENPNNESASELLKEIKKERIQLIKEKKVKKGKPVQLIKKEEKYLEIPKNWVWTRLIEAGNIFNGNSVNKSIKAAKYEGLKEGLPYLGTKDVNYGFEALNYDNGVKIPIDEPKFKIAHKNTTLICSEGGSAGKKCGITTQDICFGNKLYALEQYGNIESVYMLSIYKTPVFFEVFQSKMTGIIGGVSINSFSEIPIPLPPLEEQKEIVKVVEILFKEVEQLEQLTVARISLKEDFVTSALNQLTTNNTNQEWTFLQDHFKSFFNETTNIKKLRETVLQLAVQGKLTAGWRVNNPDTEDASVLLKRIKAERSKLIAEKKLKKTREKGDIIKGEFNISLPDSWTISKAVDLGFITKLAGFEYSKHINLQDEGEVPVIRAQNVKPNRIDERKLKYIDLETSKLLSRCELVKESLLITFIGAGIGEVAVFRKKERWHLAPNVAKLEPFNEFNHNIEIDYLLFYLLSPIGRKELFKHMKSTAQPSLSMGTIRDIIVCLPPIEEQKAIVQKVNALMGLCDSLEKEVQQSQEHSEQLMQSCLREVFEVKKEIEVLG